MEPVSFDLRADSQDIDFRRRAARGQPEPSTAACPGATSGIEPRAVAPKPSPVAVFVRLIA